MPTILYDTLTMSSFDVQFDSITEKSLLRLDWVAGTENGPFPFSTFVTEVPESFSDTDMDNSLIAATAVLESLGYELRT